MVEEVIRGNKMLKGSKEYYLKHVVPQLKEKFNFSSVMEIPYLEKIIINMGLGEAKNNKNVLTEGIDFLSLIAGQKAIVTVARKSIAGFKIREGLGIGAMVTLRNQRMYSFLTKLINVSLPRVKDFHGISRKSFDRRGNFTLGITDFRIFPETSMIHNSTLKGLSVVFVSSVGDDNVAEGLLEQLGLPFKK